MANLPGLLRKQPGSTPAEQLQLIARQLNALTAGIRGWSNGSLPDVLDGFATELRGLATGLEPAACTCPGGLPDGWRTDFDPDCPRHGTPEPTDDELRALLPAAREAKRWNVGARAALYHNDPEGDPHSDGTLVNVIVAVLREMRTPPEVRAQGGDHA